VPDDSETRSAFRVTLGIVLAVTLARCVVLALSPLDLHPDEAQYWWWARTPGFGYFSKPPMIAWIIWLSTALLGNSEWAIRIASPVLHGATSLVVFAIARRVTDARQSALSALAYITIPGLSYSCGLISTDVPLLFFWAVALYAFLRGCDDARRRWPIVCGVALGLGLESKYAMLYFLASAIAATFFAGKAHRFVFGPRGLVVLAIGLGLLAPNIAWNAMHAFPTLAHTRANADWVHARYSFRQAAEFALGQFGVFGPVLMAGLIGALCRMARAPARGEDETSLASFGLTPLLLILIQSFVARANANWAATGLIAATPLAVGELVRWWRARALWASFALNVSAMVALWIVLLSPGAADTMGIGNAFKREQGWRELGRQVARAASASAYNAIVADNRSIIAELLYYTRPRATPIRMWARDLRIRDHFEMTLRLNSPASRILLAIEPQAAGRVLATFDSAKLLARLEFPIGGHHSRVIDLYDARDYRDPPPVHVRMPVSPAPVL